MATEPPTDSPAASPQPTETSGELPAIPSDFDPLSVTFVSPTQGFVLGAVSCGATKCPLVVRTLDAGRTWAEWSGPLPTTVAEGPITAEATTGVSRIRFADTLHGWIYGPELWATSDGGASWAKMTLPKDADGPVQALETARGKVHAVTFVQSSVSFRISSAAVGSADWIVSKAKLDVGAGPVPEVQLVVQGDSGWVLQNDRTVVNGARLVNGAWQPWTPTCADVVGPAFIAGATASDLLASCEVGAWGNPQGTHLFVSTNGGVSSKETGAKVPVTSTTGIASPDGTTIVVSGATDNGAALEATFDRGASWHEVLTLTDEVPVDLGFTTPTQGVVVAVRSSVVSKLYMTRDGGHTWDAVTFQP